MKYYILVLDTRIYSQETPKLAMISRQHFLAWGLPLSSKPWSDMLHVWHNISETRRVHRHRIRDHPQPANKTHRKGSNMKQYEAIQESENQKVTKTRKTSKIRKTATVPCETASTGAGIPSCAPTPRKTNLAPSPRAMAKDGQRLSYFDLL